MGARELREGVSESGNTPSREMVALLSAEQLFDVLAIRIDGPRAGELRLSFNWVFTDTEERHVLTLSNGVLIHSADRHDPQADATVVVERAALNELFAGITPVAELLGSGTPARRGRRRAARRAARPAGRARPVVRDRHALKTIRKPPDSVSEVCGTS